MIEHYIIKSLVKKRETYERLIPKLNSITFDSTLKKLLNIIEHYYSNFEDHQYISQDQLIAYMDILYPSLKDRDVYVTLIKNIYKVDTSNKLTELKINQLKLKDYASQIAQACIPAISGESFDDILDNVETLVSDAKIALDISSNTQDDGNPFQRDSLEHLLETQKGDGLTWRIDCLNQDIGSLPGGTLGHFFARPEAGKTSWLHSEMAHFCNQFNQRGLGETVLWFNNEENKKKIDLRWFSAVTGLTKYEIANNPAHAKQLFDKSGGNLMGIVDRAVLHLEEIEAIMKKHQPRIAVIDIGDKCVFKGINSTSNSAERLKAIYDRIREISKRCNTIWKVDTLTTAQADAQAENSKWLYQTNLDGGKTGKAGAFDYIIGMGKLHSEEFLRYFYCCKNKQGDQSNKHTVTFNPMLARYGD